MTTTVDQKHRAVIPFKPGDVLGIEQQGPDVMVLKRTKQAESARPKLMRRKGRLVFATAQEQIRKEQSNRRLNRLCSALQRERNPAKIREIKDKLSQEFYFGDQVP
jgi:hypothetical protein